MYLLVKTYLIKFNLKNSFIKKVSNFIFNRFNTNAVEWKPNAAEWKPNKFSVEYI